MKITDFDVRNRVGGSLAEGIEKRSTVHGELDAHVKSGVKHLQYYYTPFFGPDGNLQSVFAYYLDKTAEISAVRDILQLTERAQAGDLDVRVDPAPYSGELRLLMEGINGTLDAIIGPLNVAAEYVDRIAKGDLPPRITEQYNGDFNEIKNNLNNCIESLTRLLNDTTQMYKQHKAGDIDASIDLAPYQGFYRDITSGYNNAVSLHVGSVLKILTILSSYSAGDFSPVLEQLPGKQALANEKLDQLRSHILALIDDCNLLIKAAVEGRLDVRADATKHQGEYRKIVEGMNHTLDAVVQPLHDAGAVLQSLVVNDHTRHMDTSQYSGDFAILADNINQVRERLITVTSLAKDIGAGNLEKLEDLRKIGRRSEQDELMPAFIKCMESLKQLITDTTMLTHAFETGDFTKRADVSVHHGEYRRIIEGINKTVETIADKVAWYESILDAVQFPIHVTDMNMNWTYMNKAFEEVLLKNKVIKDRKSAYGLPCHTANATICKTEDCGIHQLRTKGVTESYFEWQGRNGKQVTKPVVNAKGEQVGFVETVQDLTEQLNQIAYYESILDAVPMAITVTDLNSRWTFVNKAVETMLKKSRKELIGHHCNEWGANICNTENCGITRLKKGIPNTRFEQDGGYYNVDCAYVYDARGEKVGHVEVVGDVTAITKVQKYLDESVRNISDCLGRFANGDTGFEVQIPDADQYTAEVRAKMVDLTQNLHKARDSVKTLVVEANNLVQAALRGDLKHRADASRLLGDFAEVVDGVNKTLETVGIPLNTAAGWIEDVAKGRDVFDITDEYPGDYAIIKNNINESNRVLKALVAETERLSKGAIAGDLNIRSDLTQYPGAWKDIVAGFNQTLESVVTPVYEAIRVANEYAQANFTARVDPSLKVAGEWVGFKQALDNIGIQICNAIGVINKQVLELASNAEEATASVEEVSAGSQQIAKNAGSVSANAEQGDDGITQVLKAMEDLTITVGEVSQRAEKVSASATEANQFSKQGIELAKKSESAMNGIRLSTSEVDQIVKEINKQMEEIGKIVRLITDISNQTNLLALNAAIEAARAGEAGRGFAVVAAEVKSLAQDSRASAENIADMIANLQAKATKANDAIITAGTAVEDGNRALEETVSAFSKIAASIEEITKNAMDMASSSEEQAAAVEEITASVNEVSVLIQGTAKEAQDAAAATEEASASIEQIGRVIANVSSIADNISREMTKFKI